MDKSRGQERAVGIDFFIINFFLIGLVGLRGAKLNKI
jgi:hypothetical protein